MTERPDPPIRPFTPLESSRMPAIQFSVRSTTIVVAILGVVLITPNLELYRIENMIVVVVMSTVALAVEKARRQITRLRSQGRRVGRFQIVGQILKNTPFAIGIVVVCWSLNLAWDYVSLRMRIYRLFSTQSLPETIMLHWRINTCVKAGIDLCVGWAALRTRDFGEKGSLDPPSSRR